MKLLKRVWYSIRQWKGWQQFTPVRIVGILLGLFGIAFGAWTYLIAHDFALDWKTFATDYGANISTSLISFTIAVLVIDFLNERRITKEHKGAIIQQMGSPVHDAALEAVRIARLEGWLVDGSLRKKDLSGANLQRADLRGSNLQGAGLAFANLQSAILMGQVNLREAVLVEADLQKAILLTANLQNAWLQSGNFQDAWLMEADLCGANLIDANLQGAILTLTKFDEETVLPDGSHWAPATDMARFAEPDHPDFWRSDIPGPAYRGDESLLQKLAALEKKPKNRRKKPAARKT